MPVPAPTLPSSTAPGTSPAQCGPHVLRPYRTGPNVAQVAVVGLADDGIHGAHALVTRRGQKRVEKRIGDAKHAQRSGKQDRRLDLPELVNLTQPDELAESIANRDRRADSIFKQIPTVRQDRRHSGSNRITLRQGVVTDANPQHISDRVQGTRRQFADYDSDVAGARSVLRPAGRRKRADENQERDRALRT